jgi:NAD-dependent DNA ligase/predicted nucleotidyltransferase
MLASNVNSLGKIEKNAKVKAGACIFPFKYKYEEHDKCLDTNKGAICATEVNPKTKTLVKYGYCQTKSKSKSRSNKSISPKKKTKSKSKTPKTPVDVLISKMSITNWFDNLLPKKSPKKGTQKKALNDDSKPIIKLKRRPLKVKPNQTHKQKQTLKKSKSKSKSKSPPKMEKQTKPVKTIKRRKLVPKTQDLKITQPIVQETTQEIEKMTAAAKSFNEEFIEVLGELAGIMQRQGEPFKSRAYQKAQETIMTFDGDIITADQLKGMPGIGDAIYRKLKEYTETGKIALLERERNNPMNVLTNIYGVGPKKAQSLIAMGLDSISKIQALPADDVEKLFNANQKKGLEYYADINQKIPRDEIVAFDKLFGKILKECCDDKGSTSYEIVGSYRRGKAFSGDIDVIITNENNNSSVFTSFLDALKTYKTHPILEYTFSKGQTKSLTMCRLTPDSPIARRVDFLYTAPAEYPFAILYFTGSKIFNTVMRQRALKQGYTLNEHGISYMKSGVKGAKVEQSFDNEKDIFDFLGMKYKKPEERIDGRAVQDIVAGQTETQPHPQSQPQPQTITQVPTQTITEIKNVKIPRKTLKKKKTSVTDMAKKFKKDGVSYLEGLTEDELISIIQEANDAYYNKKPFLSDEEFDIVKEYVERKYPTNQVLKAVGAPIEKGKEKVKLPYNMPSMNKIKPDTDALAKWKTKYTGPYMLSTKLDGVSGMFVIDGTTIPEMKLYTRGDGTYGQDITHLIPYLRLPTQSNKIASKIAIRGEFIIPKKLFDDKYSKEFSNPRNFIAGLINSKTVVPSKHRDIDFVAYEVIEPEMKPSEQFEFLKSLSNGGKDLRVVYNEIIPSDKLTNELLSNELTKLRGDAYEYEIDGIIVADDKIYARTPENPEHAFAFKMVLSDQVAEVKVLDVLWSPSKDGYLKPRVQVEPVVLGGAKIEYATGFNAKFIEDNKIGVGAVIKLVRSGDVIPHIMSVVKPAEQAMMPMVEWKWNSTKVDAVLVDKSQDETVITKTITLFFKHLEVAGMGPGNVAKLVAAGYNTIPKVINAEEVELQKILGKKTGSSVFNNVKQTIQNVSLASLMTATNIFGRGFGDKRFVSIIVAMPDILLSVNQSGGIIEKDYLIGQIAKIKGMSYKTAEEFLSNLPEFVEFLKEAKLDNLITQTKEKTQAQNAQPVQTDLDTSHPLYGKKIVMTGFRDKELMAEITGKGGEMTDSVSKNTFAVLVKHEDEDTGKTEKAKKLSIQILTPENFRQKYLQ